MDNWQDLYEILQVHPDAEPDMIQNAYKRLCKKYHPDVNPSPRASERMGRINCAYEVLGSEARRRAYHAEWLRRGPARAVGAPRVEVRERVVYVNREPPPSHGGTQAAYQVLRDYFMQLSARRYKEAFALVSEADKKCFSFGDFAQWQESVSAIYEIGGVELKLFKRHDAGKLNPELSCRAEEFTVWITEKNKATGAVRRYAINKYAAFEGFSWRVYLGYRNLAPLMMQFRMMATTPEEARIACLWDKYKEEHDIFMGLPNRRGFEQRFDILAYTHRRYGRDFSLAVFQALPPEPSGAGMRGDLVVKYVGYILADGVRCIDTAAYLGDCRFAVLMAETGREAATQAARRLLKTARHDVAACFDFEAGIHVGVSGYAGQSADEAVAECVRTIEAAAGEGRTAAGEG